MGSEIFGEKIIFSSAPVPGINNDQSLSKRSIIIKLRVKRAPWFSVYNWQVVSTNNIVTELKVGIFARRAMVDQARDGLCYQWET